MNPYGITNSSDPSDNYQPSLHPQFNNQGGWGKSVKKWMEKNFNTIILPLLAILVIAAGFYVYLDQRKQTESVIKKDDVKTAEKSRNQKQADLNITLNNETLTENAKKEVNIELDNLEIDNLDRQKSEIVVQNQNKSQESAKSETDVKESDKQITLTAQKGEGITHLARKAAQYYLAKNDAGFEIKKEHLIFIEDFLKDKKESKLLEIGEELTFSTDEIQKAFEAARQLNENQIRNLSQYVSLVNFSN